MSIDQMLGLSAKGPAADWLMFIVMLAAIGLGVGTVVVWMFVFRPKSKKRRKRHQRRHRRHNPTLAQSGGLPPVRDSNQPPPGP